MGQRARTGARGGRPPIGPELHARVTPEVMRKLRDRAREREVPLAAVVREIIERGIDDPDVVTADER